MAQRKPAAMSDDELFAGWQNGIERIYDEMIALGWNRRMFRMMREVVEANPRVQETCGHVIDWMFGNDVLSAAMSLRRDVDRDSSTLSLRRLLHEIADRPETLNRERYRRQWGIDGNRPVDPDDMRATLDRARCDRAFDVFANQASGWARPRLH
jgi:hypothetical protein